MSGPTSTQVLLKTRPHGIPQSEHFEIASRALPKLESNQILVKNHFLSADPAMRGWLNPTAEYSTPVEIGEVIRALATGEVIDSMNPNFAPGERVMGMFGWQTHAIVTEQAVFRRVTEKDIPFSTSLGTLGLTGLSAYFGLLDLAAPKRGETVVVSTAAGAVGSCVGQIAKIRGCRTIGITGGSQKANLCKELFGYDEVFDYKSADDLSGFLRRVAPKGIDVYFDNTAGSISDAVIPNLTSFARVVVCGTASQPTWSPWPMGPRVERHILTKRLKMQGFVIMDYQSRYEEATPILANWIRSGELKYREEILNGIEEAPDSIARLYRGENLGKLLIKII